ncbi:hypothetical protein GCM10009841_29000 [Microlunatus panaciterrae]|uniref:Uncharacterized protein n=1 Tax=Microlunatus panaciterrae TaxID=400768 RepID=A0ABS2REY3_9ACTN|nr:hypothetical protein [Microlunatus panaciterrae]MBM7797560.1 hypothetical protein [Microlunatus panaciterrae]
MSTLLLDARLALIDEATAAAQAAANADPPDAQAQLWLDQLVADRALLTGAPESEHDDDAFRAAAVLWAATTATGADVLQALAADPVYLARGVAPATTAAIAAVVAANPRRRQVWGSTPGVTSDILDELLGEGLRWWLGQPVESRPPLSDADAPLNRVTVLLPVTIETRFHPEKGAPPGGQVWVRVTPDAMSVSSHRPGLSSAEIGALRQVRAAAGGDSSAALAAFLDSTAGRALWQRLCNEHTPARAAWMLADSAGRDLDGVVADDSHHPARVVGFPEQIEIWVTWTDQTSERIGTGRPVDRAALAFDLPGDDADAWWNSWEAAKAVGVGVECDLPRPPEQIDALYALGLSPDPPAEVWAAKAAAGELAAVEPGAATNTVAGAPAVDLGADPQTWAQLLRRRLDLAAAGVGETTEHSGALTGRDDAIGLYPTPQFDFDGYGRLLQAGLFPALFGHPLKDVWGVGGGVHPLARWMSGWVRPLGHLLPLRSGDLPYGVLPVTSLDRWELHPVETRDADVARVEPELVRVLRELRPRLAAAAGRRGTSIGADPDALVTLVSRTPTATGYGYQSFDPEGLIDQLLAAALGADPNRDDRLHEALRARFEPANALRGDEPQRYYLATGGIGDSGLQLIVPTVFPGLEPDQVARMTLRDRLTATVDLLRRLQRNLAFDGHQLVELFPGAFPDSLLIRLLLQASVQARADAARADPATVAAQPIPDGGDGPRLEPIFGPQRPIHWQWAEQLTLADQGTVDTRTEAGSTYQLVGEGVELLARMLEDQLAQVAPDDEATLRLLVERLEWLFSNLLDTSATRLDPFATAVAWRRLSTLRADPTTAHQLGIYGWVEKPYFGRPGPKPGGLLHAPSHAQVVTSIILRDRYLAERSFDGGAGSAWQMSLTSRRIRMAAELGTEVAMGSHLREVLGRRVEAIVDDAVHIRELREDVAPARTADPDRFTVCDGERVLELLSTGGLPAWLTEAQRGRLQLWADALDAYSDLLVAQGVQQAVTRRFEAASSTMDAAAGFAGPPDLEVVQTVRAGQSVMSTLLAALPYRPADEPGAGGAADVHPAAVADGSVAGYLEELFGPAESWQWTGQVQGLRPAAAEPPEGAPVPAPLPVAEASTVSLADLGLTVMDAMLYPPDKLGFAAGQRMLDGVAAAQPDAYDLDVAAPAATRADDHRLGRDLVAALAGKPFQFADLHLPTETAPAAAPTAAEAADLAVRQELLTRLRTLLTAGSALADQLADPVQAEAALRLALRWGIATIDRSLSPADRAAAAREALQARLDKAQSFLDTAAAAEAAPNAAGRSTQPAAAEIAETISALAAPEGGLAVLGRVDSAALTSYEPDRPLRPAPDLDEQWLTVLAPVRSRLARLEALQLEPLRSPPPEHFAGLTCYANRPDDPWQKQPVIDNRARRTGGAAAQPSRLIAAYGTDGVFEAAEVAVGTIDSWGETVPEPRHTTQAAFHFNAPGARAPQAVLVAVPPVLDQQTGTDVLLDVVRETRELAKARMVAVEDLGELAPVLPLAMLSTPEPWNRALLSDSTRLDF